MAHVLHHLPAEDQVGGGPGQLRQRRHVGVHEASVVVDADEVVVDERLDDLQPDVRDGRPRLAQARQRRVAEAAVANRDVDVGAHAVLVDDVGERAECLERLALSEQRGRAGSSHGAMVHAEACQPPSGACICATRHSLACHTGP